MTLPLSEETQTKIAELYQSGLSTREVAKRLGTYSSTVSRILKRIGIASRPLRQYSVNEDFFEVIDTPAKAYWFGFLMADGCVRFLEHGAYVCLHVQAGDVGHLEKFRAVIGSTAPIAYTKAGLVRIEVCSVKLAKDLTVLGCTPRKSRTLQFPTMVPNELLNHFIRGYFDGNGCLCFSGRNTCWSLISASLLFLENVQDVLVQRCGVRKIKIYFHDAAYRLIYGGNRQVSRILDWLYIDSTPEVRLDRKYELYLEFKGKRIAKQVN